MAGPDRFNALLTIHPPMWRRWCTGEVCVDGFGDLGGGEGLGEKGRHGQGLGALDVARVQRGGAQPTWAPRI